MLYRTSKQFRGKLHHALPLSALVVAVLLFVLHVPMPRFLSNVAQWVATPVWLVQERLSDITKDVRTSFGDKHLLAEENAALLAELATLRRESYLVRMYQRENAELREMLGRAEEESGLIPTSIIHSEVWAPYDTFIIDAGSRLGVRGGMLVVGPDNIALGSVIRALASRSVVALFSAPGKETNVVIRGTSTKHTLMTGVGAGTMLMSIPREIVVQPGDPVVLSSFPSYVVGNIADIRMRPEDAQQTIYVRSPSNTHAVRFVLVDVLHAWEPPAELQPETLTNGS
jgi:cell shape-determining protein MreC